MRTETDQSELEQKPVVVSFAGYSGSGKTTLVEAVISQLSQMNYRIGAIKHDGHNFDIDKPGKDSWRMTQAGAEVTVISDSEKLAMIKQHRLPPEPFSIVSDYFADMDIVIVEGWKDSAPNRIEVHRSVTGYQPLCLKPDAKGFIAVVSDSCIETDLPQLDINSPSEVVDFIVSTYLSSSKQDQKSD